MKITAQEEYGLRCLVQLARAPQGELTTVKAVAEKEGLSSAYVEKLLRLLGSTGLVHSVRGAQGGYALNRPATQISLGEVIRALGDLPETEHICATFTGKEETCVHFNDCGLRSVWAGLSVYLQHFLDRTMVADILGKEHAVSVRLTKLLQ